MQITMFSGDPKSASADLIAVGIFSGKKRGNSTFDAIDKKLDKALSGALRREDFKGKAGEHLSFNTLKKGGSQAYAVLGLGKSADVTPKTLLNFAGSAVREGNRSGAKSVLLVFPELDQSMTTLAELGARGVVQGSYRYDTYRSKPGRKSTARKISFAVGTSELSSEQKKETKAAINRGCVIGESVALGRDLVNQPPSDLYPETFAARATEVGGTAGLEVKVYEPAELADMGMNLLLGVGQGSAQTPRLVHLSYVPENGAADAKPVVFVGKGITFDSGGLCLKPPAGMLDMKIDMGGAAAVLGAMNAVGQLKPDVPVHGILALAENMPSGTAFRLGDVITGAAGRSVEVNNTDAEGRLVLADALHFAVGLGPARIVDLATLTGACMVALGPHTVGLFSNSDDLAGDILASSSTVGEHFWRMPLTEELKDQLKSDIADTKNTGERFGGAITAALFLREFVDGVDWAHLDIAGPATASSDKGAAAKGGSGVGVATLVELVCG